MIFDFLNSSSVPFVAHVAAVGFDHHPCLRSSFPPFAFSLPLLSGNLAWIQRLRSAADLRVFPVGCRIRLNVAISKITPSPSISLSIVDYLIIMDSIEVGLAALRLEDESNIRATARKFDLVESTLRRRYNRQIVSMKRARFLIHHRLFQAQKRALIIQINHLIDRGILSTTRMMRNFAEEIVKNLVDKNWAENFVKRYRHELKSIYLRNMNSSRVKTEYASIFKQFYDLMGDIFLISAAEIFQQLK